MNTTEGRLPKGAIAIAAALICFVVVLDGLGIRWNRTASAPRGIYQIRKATYEVGYRVAVCLPAQVAAVALERGYLTQGDCPGGSSAVVKTVGAIEGDLVHSLPEGIRINGTLTQQPPPETDSKGQPLEILPTNRRLRAGELWLLSEHPRSWDSRFYGPARKEWVQGKVRPLWVLRDSDRP